MVSTLYAVAKKKKKKEKKAECCLAIHRYEIDTAEGLVGRISKLKIPDSYPYIHRGITLK